MGVEEIYEFLVESQAIEMSELHEDADLNREFGIEGDDFSEMIELFTEKYGIDMSEYLWYFHHQEEGWNLGALFFKPPYSQVSRIKVTPKILAEAATKKIWPIVYPPHQIRDSRPDLTVNKVFIGGTVSIGLLLWVSSKIGN